MTGIAAAAPILPRPSTALPSEITAIVLDLIQHGTAIVVLAGIINALKVTGKKKEDCAVVVNGAG